MKSPNKKLRYSFTKPKFVSFPLKKQHKKCSEMLRHIYDLLLAKQPFRDDFDHYNELQVWMNESKLHDIDLKSVADRYHEHLKKGGVSFKEHNLLPRVTSEDRVDGEEPWPIATYLDNIRSAHNVGSILRTVECLRLGPVYFGGQTPHSDHKQVKDASMGTSDYIKCHIDASIHDLPRPIIVLETSPDAISLHDFIFPEQFTLVIGNEEYGCSDEILHESDYLLTIPMRGRKNSLNVANAFSMAAQEIARQRQE